MSFIFPATRGEQSGWPSFVFTFQNHSARRQRPGMPGPYVGGFTHHRRGEARLALPTHYASASCGFNWNQLILYVMQLHQPWAGWGIFEVKRGCLKNIRTQFVPGIPFGEDRVTQCARNSHLPRHHGPQRSLRSRLRTGTAAELSRARSKRSFARRFAFFARPNSVSTV